jgi:mono/diheme cytochrome c family protein
VEPAEDQQLAAGKLLYGNHCAQCHGDQGDGNGPAAQYLYPKPRNFGEAKFRLATTDNRLPTDDDLFRVITRGMPGSAMFPFGHLSEAERQALVQHVRRLTRDGLAERFRRDALAAGETVNPAELARDAERLSQPGQPVVVPADLAPPGPESVAGGRQLYAEAGCASCHGQTGKGDGAQEQRDDDGTPTRPRDFSRGIFKGGREPAQLYARIIQGMPGTPMPSSAKLTPAEVGDLINFIHSLSDPAAQAKVEHQRTRLVVKRSAQPLAGEISAAEWEAAPAARVTVSPLWWRDYAEPDLHVQALHDGQTLAVRLTWQDATRNEQVARPEDFEDMAAVQLFQGEREPFLGMGAADSPVDVWLWRASWQAADDGVVSLLDDYPFDAPVYRERIKGKDKPLPEFLTARAAGNLHAHADRGQSGSSLTVKGFGSTTFRPKASQLVTASATWQDGRWTVVLRRPLGVRPDDGLSLAAGAQAAVAFALWDGAALDRNGQKLVSIWHDLKLE